MFPKLEQYALTLQAGMSLLGAILHTHKSPQVLRQAVNRTELQIVDVAAGADDVVVGDVVDG